MAKPSYRGRFAPSPTGPLHMGSLIAALGSYLDAKQHGGSWLIRMEDLDTPRCMPGAADEILRTLEKLGLCSDECVLYQSTRTRLYAAALEKLKDKKLLYPCGCTRREIADSALQGLEGPVYPGTCRNGIPEGREPRAWRIRTCDESTAFIDTLQGAVSQNLQREIGDFVLKRADGLYAYQLAVVVDDADQGITDVVRGADLLNSTARQIYLQRMLNLATPRYLHLPVLVNEEGEKLSKQTRAPAVDLRNPSASLTEALRLLRQHPPAELRLEKTETILNWAVQNWQPQALSGIRQIA